MAKRKKQTRRSKQQYPNLDPAYNLKSRADLIDYDYLDKLSPEEKAWLDKFTSEYTNASFDKENLSNNLHNTQELVKDCEDSNNRRNADLLVKMKSSKKLDYMTTELDRKAVDYEDYLINLVDRKKK